MSEIIPVHFSLLCSLDKTINDLVAIACPFYTRDIYACTIDSIPDSTCPCNHVSSRTKAIYMSYTSDSKQRFCTGIAHGIYNIISFSIVAEEKTNSDTYTSCRGANAFAESDTFSLALI